MAGLPIIDENFLSSSMRTQEQLIHRALILNVMLRVSFKAPTTFLYSWLDKHNLCAYLSNEERRILSTPNSDLREQDIVNCRWLMDALWALLWAGQITNDLNIDGLISDNMYQMCPQLEHDEGVERFKSMQLRSSPDIYAMLDLYYRAHWYARDAQLNGRDTGIFNASVILERRRALEWLMDDSSDWDFIELST